MLPVPPCAFQIQGSPLQWSRASCSRGKSRRHAWWTLQTKFRQETCSLPVPCLLLAPCIPAAERSGSCPGSQSDGAPPPAGAAAARGHGQPSAAPRRGCTRAPRGTRGRWAAAGTSPPASTARPGRTPARRPTAAGASRGRCATAAATGWPGTCRVSAGVTLRRVRSPMSAGHPRLESGR